MFQTNRLYIRLLVILITCLFWGSLAEAVTISNLMVSRPYFNPNQGQNTVITATLSAAVNWRIDIINSGGTTVKTKNSSQPETNVSYNWNGLTSNGNPHPEDLYTVRLTADPGANQVTADTWTVIDKTDPTINIDDPTNEEILSNVRQAGSSEFSILGSITDQFAQQQGQIASWILDFGYTWDPGAWTELKNVTTPATSVNINEIWKTIFPALVNNGKATIRVRAYDGAGNFKQKLRKVWVSNFRMDHNVLQFKPTAGQSVSIKSYIPEPLTLKETLKIFKVYNPGPTEQPVIVLKNNVVRAGNNTTPYSDPWDGKDSQLPPVIVPDKGYFYIAEVTEQGTSNTMTWPQPSYPYLEGLTDSHDHPTILSSIIDPFNNKPLRFRYHFQVNPLPGQVVLVVSSGIYFGGVWLIPSGCSNLPPPDYEPLNTCLTLFEYGDSGPHDIIWAGVDDSGKIVDRINGVASLNIRKQFRRNAVVVYGSLPVIEEIFLDPPFYNPLKGNLNVRVKFNLFVGTTAKVTISFTNQRCLVENNPIDTCTLHSSVNNSVPDPATYADFPWSGKSGTIWVSPGLYIVTVTVQDNTTKSEITQKALLTVDFSSFN